MKQSPVITVLVFVSVLVNVAVAAGFVYLANRSIDNGNSIRASDIQQCHVANVTRVQDIAIWNRLLAVPASAKRTAAQKAEVADLKHLVQVKDTPRNCTAAYKAK